MKDKTFIVPHDFTSVADTALNHALITALKVNAKILILHVVPKADKVADATKKLTEFIRNTDAKGIELIPFVRVGNIFEDIAEFATENNAGMIFMGTHGASGWQHVTGSHAMKVITNSAVPFIVVQEKKIRTEGYNDIVVPLDLNKETKQKLVVVAELAHYFDSRVHIVTPDENDDFLLAKVKANISFAKTFFAERKIEITVTMKPKSNFDKEVVKHAVAIDADLVAIMNLVRNSLFAGLGSGYEQYMITNDAQIPVLIMNPIENSYGSSVLFG
jgi:nucleotide-binding universal stress UspA family protein